MTPTETIRNILIDLSATSKGEDIAIEALKELDEIEKQITAISEYVSAHSVDIEAGINDFGCLQPLLKLSPQAQEEG